MKPRKSSARSAAGSATSGALPPRRRASKPARDAAADTARDVIGERFLETAIQHGQRLRREDSL